jgi:hypothetical protein
MTGQVRSNDVWQRAERAVVKGDASTLDALLRDHGDVLRRGPVQSTWCGGLAPDYSNGDARAIIAREHRFDSWDAFAAFVAASSDRSSPVARFEAAVDAVVTGDEATLADADARAEIYGGSDTLGLVATSIHPATAGVQEELLALLLARGAPVGTARGTEAWASLINGCHANGRGKAARFLAERAPALDLEAAAGVGRLDVVETFFAPDGKLRNATAQQMKDGFTWACEFGRAEVVDFLLRRGMGVSARLRHHGQTGLHWAACGGHADTVRLLLQRQAPVNARDEVFEGTPLGWALYAWAGAPSPDRDSYYAVVDLLLAAGGTVEPEWLAEEKRGFPIARMIGEDARMRAALGRGQ